MWCFLFQVHCKDIVHMLPGSIDRPRWLFESVRHQDDKNCTNLHPFMYFISRPVSAVKGPIMNLTDIYSLNRHSPEINVVRQM